MITKSLNQRKLFEQESFLHIDALWKIARWLTTRDSHAEKIVLNTMAQAYSEWAYSVNSINNKTRLFQILAREILGFGTQRKKRNHSRQFLSENIRITADSKGENARDILSALDQLQLKMANGFSEESVRGIIAHLRPQSRLILMLLYIGKFSYADIAFIMDISRNSVRVILARVRTLFPKYMLEYIECIDKNAKSQPAFILHGARSKFENPDVLSRWTALSSNKVTFAASRVEGKNEIRAVADQNRE